MCLSASTLTRDVIVRRTCTAARVCPASYVVGVANATVIVEGTESNNDDDDDEDLNQHTRRR